MLLAQAALQSGFAGEPAARTASLAERAWDGCALLAHESAGSMTWRLRACGLCRGGAAVELAS